MPCILREEGQTGEDRPCRGSHALPRSHVMQHSQPGSLLQKHRLLGGLISKKGGLAAPVPAFQVAKLKTKQGLISRYWGKLGFILGPVLDPGHGGIVAKSGLWREVGIEIPAPPTSCDLRK